MRNDELLSSTTQINRHKHLVCWKSTLAGLAIAIVVFLGVTALSLAFGGIGLSDGTSPKAAGAFAAGSLILATILAALSGGYVTTRLGRTEVDMLGTVQGMIVGAVFLIILLFQVTSVVGSLGKMAGQTIGSAAVAASENSVVQDVVQDILGDLQLKSDPVVVAKGFTSRMVRGDEAGAKQYLANQTGISASEVDNRVAAAKTKMDEATNKIRETTAKIMRDSGWSLFVLIVLGMIASGLGGLLAAKRNEKYTLDTHDDLKKEYKRTRI